MLYQKFLNAYFQQIEKNIYLTIFYNWGRNTYRSISTGRWRWWGGGNSDTEVWLGWAGVTTSGWRGRWWGWCGGSQTAKQSSKTTTRARTSKIEQWTTTSEWGEKTVQQVQLGVDHGLSKLQKQCRDKTKWCKRIFKS